MPPTNGQRQDARPRADLPRRLPFLIASLFATLFALQGLDWISTCLAGPSQYEANRVLIVLATAIPFSVALAITKVIDAALIGLLGWAWRRSGGKHDLEFFACLTVLNLAYAPVVANNFLHR